MTTMTSSASPASVAARGTVIAAWTFQLVAAVILGQTLFFKFTGAPESVYIFETLGAEPWGRLGSGGVELAAVGLLLRAPTARLGAGVALAAMVGAIGAHLGPLGLEVQGDGGTLFVLASVVALSAAAVLVLRTRLRPPSRRAAGADRSI
jgi:hypothetical protein